MSYSQILIDVGVPAGRIPAFLSNLALSSLRQSCGILSCFPKLYHDLPAALSSSQQPPPSPGPGSSPPASFAHITRTHAPSSSPPASFAHAARAHDCAATHASVAPHRHKRRAMSAGLADGPSRQQPCRRKSTQVPHEDAHAAGRLQLAPISASPQPAGPDQTQPVSQSYHHLRSRSTKPAALPRCIVQLA